MASSRSKPDSSGQPYTLSETAFNADLRLTLKVQGLGALHVRETDNPGAYDLFITLPARAYAPRSVWAELKVWDYPLEASQISFYNERKKLHDALCVMRLREDHAVMIRNGLDTETYVVVPNFRLHDWKKTIADLLKDL